MSTSRLRRVDGERGCGRAGEMEAALAQGEAEAAVEGAAATAHVVILPSIGAGVVQVVVVPLAASGAFPGGVRGVAPAVTGLFAQFIGAQFLRIFRWHLGSPSRARPSSFLKAQTLRGQVAVQVWQATGAASRTGPQFLYIRAATAPMALSPLMRLNSWRQWMGLGARTFWKASELAHMVF